MRLQALGQQLYQKDTLVQMFSFEFCEISKNTFSIEHLKTMASKVNIVDTTWEIYLGLNFICFKAFRFSLCIGYHLLKMTYLKCYY